jgi:hypothetical protein
MVKSESDAIVARFVYNPLLGSKRGNFKLRSFDGGKDWELIVLLSGNAVLEYLRKASG